MHASTKIQPLKELLVLDLSRVLAGPWCTQYLADMGARVIKVEKPSAGDDTRHWGPPHLHQEGDETANISAYFLSANRGKESIALDISQPEAQALLHRLIPKVDVVVENFKQGGLARYKLDYDSLKALKPDLIYCSITGFGQTGPDKGKPGYDAMIQAMGGLMSITGTPEQGPLKTGVAISDLMTGMYASNAILSALVQRNSQGNGAYIDISLLDCQMAWLANQGMNYLVSGQPPAPIGNAHPSIVPYQSFATAGDHIVIAVGNDQQFQRFCQVLQRPDLAQNERYQTNNQRLAHRQPLIDSIQQTLLTQPAQYWQQQCEQAGVPCSVVNNLQQAFDLKQVKHREVVQTLHHPEYGSTPTISNPVHMDGQRLSADIAPPTRGQHTRALLEELWQLTPEQIRELEQRQCIE